MKLRLKTTQNRQIVDITDDVADVLREAGNKTGVVMVSAQHTTCALTTADLDPGTDQDFLDFLNSLIPDIEWRHPHDSAHAPSHLLSSLIGTAVIVPVNDGQLKLGNWQRIILVELDGPRQRELTLNFLPST